MKELSIEEKAKRYDELLTSAKNTIEVNQAIPDIVECVESLFPELAENKDEKIRKNIISYLALYKDAIGEEYESWIAWLEMQGELVNSLSKGLDNAHERIDELIQKNNLLIEQLEKLGEQNSDDKAEPKFKVGDTIAEKNNSDIHDFGSFTITDITGGKYWYNDRIICDISEQDEWEIYEPVRQKPTEWSEEDETRLTNIIIMLKEGASRHFIKDDITKAVYWLKFLKGRYTWKPSDEQITWLYRAADDASKDSRMKQVLNNLLSDLKKLREE